MGSTERRLGPADLGGCLRLSQAAGWNQNEADWRLMLGFGQGWGIALEDGTLAASTLVLPYGERIAWIAMVLVLPGHRKQGHARRLLHTALAELKRQQRTPILDATPAGRAVYVQEGFGDCWDFSRWALSSFSSDRPSGGNAKPMTRLDWPRILEFDRRAFGADREVVLRNLAARLPEAALVTEGGFVLGRDGREAYQLGPLVAKDEQTARDLLGAALARVKPPLYLDLVDRLPGLKGWLQERGFVFQRPFTRMAHGAGGAPGDASLVCCPAGAELG